MFVRSSFALLAAACALSSSSAHAHVSLTSGPGYANQSQVLNFGVGHGCEGADTVRVEITIPKEATNIRAMPSPFGDAQVKLDDAGVVSSVVFSKDKARAVDDAYYQLSIRIKVPDAPFTTLYFPAKQVCRSADGKETTVDWAALPGDPPKEGETEAEPAPALTVLPVRYPGWNKITVEKGVKDLKVFDDAQIVWQGNAAYSSNPATADLIKSEDGVTQLSEIKAGAEIWVKY
jgi:periplasmic copper chaperone A